MDKFDEKVIGYEYTTHSAALVRLFVLQLFHSAALS